jgi:hypothetical protein
MSNLIPQKYSNAQRNKKRKRKELLLEYVITMALNDDKTAMMAHILRVARDGVGKDKIMQQLPSLS